MPTAKLNRTLSIPGESLTGTTEFTYASEMRLDIDVTDGMANEQVVCEVVAAHAKGCFLYVTGCAVTVVAKKEGGTVVASWSLAAGEGYGWNANDDNADGPFPDDWIRIEVTNTSPQVSGVQPAGTLKVRIQYDNE